MSQITPALTVDDEQAKLISESADRIEVRDRNGKFLGYMSPKVDHDFTEEEIAMFKKRMNSDGPWYTTKEVLAHLKSLEDGFTENEPASVEDDFDLTEADIAIAKMARDSKRTESSKC